MPFEKTRVTSLHLAFKAHDIHELGCHFVARHAGLYDRYKLRPTLVDSTFTPDDELPAPSFHAACGAALAAWLQGADTRVVFVATDRPMFWLCAQPDIRSLADLADRLVAGYPPAAPPAVFLRQIWAERGLAPDALQVEAARDDNARIGLLQDGHAAAALVSSATPPSVMTALGFQPLVFLGDEIRVATTGLAVHASLCEQAPELVRAMCACYLDALRLIHGDASVVQAALRGVAAPIGGDAAELAALLKCCYTAAGRSPLEALQTGADRMAVAMGVDTARPVSGLYDFSFLD